MTPTLDASAQQRLPQVKASLLQQGQHRYRYDTVPFQSSFILHILKRRIRHGLQKIRLWEGEKAKRNEKHFIFFPQVALVTTVEGERDIPTSFATAMSLYVMAFYIWHLLKLSSWKWSKRLQWLSRNCTF